MCLPFMVMGESEHTTSTESPRVSGQQACLSATSASSTDWRVSKCGSLKHRPSKTGWGCMLAAPPEREGSEGRDEEAKGAW